MDQKQVGALICRLRKEKQMTQLQLAERLGVSDKAVSKWERGLGCPEISLLPQIAAVFGVDLEKMLTGGIARNENAKGDLRKTRFYLCPQCGNLLLSTDAAEVSCCGRRLKPAEPRNAAEDEKLGVDKIENDYFISSGHPMTKEHYITFVALLAGDSVLLRRQYPEWDLAARIPAFAHGKLVWHCSKHGLFMQPV